MANVTANQHFGLRGRPEKMPARAAVSTTFYSGQWVFARHSAGGVVSVPASGDRLLGVAPAQKVVLAGDTFEYWFKGVFLIPFVGCEAADIGRNIIIRVAAMTNNPSDAVVFDDEIAANGFVDDYSLLVGRCIAVDGSRGWVALNQGPGQMASGFWV